MNKPLHTPGPWKAVTNGDTHPTVAGPNGKSLFGTANSKSTLHQEKCANVTLAAAAPDLLDAVKRVRAILSKIEVDGEGDPFAALNGLTAVIVKAEGSE